MKKLFNIIFIAFTAALTVCGCQNELELDSMGGVISFNPSIGGSSDSEMTKTSSLSSADGDYEVPVWLTVSEGIGECALPETKGEQLNTGASNQSLATYSTQIGAKFLVSGWAGSSRFMPESSSSDSYAAVSYSSNKWSTSAEYEWDGSDSRTFYAYANLPAKETGVVDASITCSSKDIQILTYSIVPASASKQKDILMGYYAGTGTKDDADKTCSADITFYHPLTAVRFKKGAFEGITDIKFKAIYISDVYKSGTATMTPSSIVKSDSGEKFVWTNLSTSMQEASLEPAGSSSHLLVSSTSSIIGDSFLLIPQTMSSTKPVTVTVVVEINGSVHPLTFTLTDGSWQAGKTYTYSLGYSDGVYEFSVDVDELVFDNTFDALTKSIYTVSYKSSKSNPSNKEAVGYKAYTSTDGGTTWKNFSAYSAAATYLQKSNSGSTTATERKIREAEKNSEIIPTYFWKDDTVEADDWDLSRCGIGGEGYSASNPQNTANCYIVKHPGSYKFPCVYGNAIKNGATNSSSYSTTATGSYATLLNMVNAEGVGISDPYILTDMDLGSSTSVKASLLWTDRNTDAGLLIQNVEYSNNYISFETCDKDNLAEGNAVIVLYNDQNSDGSYTEGEGLWSWHIWVSHNDLGSSNVATVTDPNNGTQHSFMSRDLGFQTGEKRKFYDMDTYLIKLVQDGSNLEKVITVRRPGATIILPGYCTFYQYGRPTAFPGPSKYFKDEFGKVTVYGPSGSVINSIKGDDTPFSSVSSGTALLGKFLSYPNLAATARKLPSPSSALRYYVNLWSANLTTLLYSHNILSNLPVVVKTVYDPSPYGYCIPNPQAFSYLTGGEDQRNYSTDASLMNCEYDGADDKRCTFILDAGRNRMGDVRFLLGGYLSNFSSTFTGANIWSSGYYQTTALFQNDFDSVVRFGGGTGGIGLNMTDTNDGLQVHPVLE